MTQGIVAIVAIVRDEAAYLAEWVAFHRAQGVSEFVIFDNGSVDGTPNLAASLGIEPIIWAGRPHNFDEQQRTAYVHGAQLLAGRAEWVAFIDADEFMFGRGTTLAEALAGFPEDVSAVAVQQHIFGSSGHMEAAPAPVTRRFTRRMDSAVPSARWFKTIARPEAIVEFSSVHSVVLRHGHYVLPDGSPLERLESHPGVASRRVDGKVGLHHYMLKSFAEFRAKQRRWADRLQADRVTEDRFHAIDAVANAIEDFTLAGEPEA